MGGSIPESLAEDQPALVGIVALIITTATQARFFFVCVLFDGESNRAIGKFGL